MLLIIENVLSKAQVKECRLHLDKAQWLSGAATAGSSAVAVKANQQLDDNSAVAKSLRTAISDIVLHHPKFISACLPKQLFPPKFNRYQQDAYYGLHVDNAIMSVADVGVMRTDISVSLFLAEADEYDGGELMIETGYGPQSIKLNAGDLVLYPSNSLHEVKPVTRGVRLASFFWLQSLVANKQQREQLFDLDQCIQTLTTERGVEDGQVKKLSQLYHNLLRDWAQA